MIKQVAIYLRKSREQKETDDVLSKHRDTLVELANKNGWNYVIYEEIMSGERIAFRPVMQQLLEDIEEGKHDAVLVMDIDRLGRGNSKDWGIIYESLSNDHYNTIVITPEKTYDLTNESDEMMMDFKALISKNEYRLIKKRFKQGKIAGAKQGKWVCGNPPYPYYTTKEKTLEVNHDKLAIYRMIIERYLSGDSLEDISIFLNTNKVPSPKNGNWSARTIQRLLTNETHLGYVIYGKTKGDTRKNNFCKISEENWIKTKANHFAVKTEEEHLKILDMLASKHSIPLAARKRIFILSGLLFCGKCGYRMQIKRSGSGYYCAMCLHKYSDGSKCKQKGISLRNEFYQAIYDEIFTIQQSILDIIKIESVTQTENNILISNFERALSKEEAALSRLYDLYENGEMDKNIFLDRKNKKEHQKKELVEKLHEMKSSNKHIEGTIDFERGIADFRTLLTCSATDQQINKALQSAISKIVYDREKDQVSIKIVWK